MAEKQKTEKRKVFGELFVLLGLFKLAMTEGNDEEN